MGHWNMTVVGTGAHHNPSYDGDADKLFREFVAHLKRKGHLITHASFTFSGREDHTHTDPPPKEETPAR